MASRRDQLHSYQFMVQRVVSALVFRKTDPDQSPFRRAGGSVFASVMIAILSLAVAGVIGFISRGGNESYKEGNAVIIEKETGSRYVYIDGKLHPVLNFVSGALIAGSSNILSLSRGSLEDVPRGVPVGIQGAPDSVPEADMLLDGDWSLCSRPGTTETGGAELNSVLYIGSQPAQGRALLGGQAVIASVADTASGKTKYYLIADHHRFAITDPENVDAIGGSTSNAEKSFRAEAAFINSIPEGAAISTPAFGTAGEASAIDGAPVGTVFQDGTGKWAVVLTDGWAEISPLQSALVQAATKNTDVRKVASVAAIGARSSTTLYQGSTSELAAVTEVPDVQTVSPGTSACSTFHDGDALPGILIDATVPEGGGIETSKVTSVGRDLVNEVIMPPGHAAVVESIMGDTAGTVGFVNELGVYYPFASRDVLKIFGYSESDVVKLPETLISRLPYGVTLDPEAAKKNAIINQK